jgi:preprotein translocase subunit SecE
MSAQAGQTSNDDKRGTTLPEKPRVTTMEFISQVRQEASKVTWPTRKETTTTAIAVFIMVVLAMIFFFTVDWLIGNLVSLVLNLV